jgi:hypothetical protein
MWMLLLVGLEDKVREGNTIRRRVLGDFYDDDFGRPTHNTPKNAKEDGMHLNLPSPGFQKTTAQEGNSQESAGLAMMMSEIRSEELFLNATDICSETSEGPQKSTYSFHDMSSRVDLVDNAGLGELNDYMISGREQTNIETVEKVISQIQIISKTNASRNRIDGVMHKIDQAGSELFCLGFPQLHSGMKTIISRATGFFNRIFR